MFESVLIDLDYKIVEKEIMEFSRIKNMFR